MDVFNKIDLHIHSAKSGITKTGDIAITKNSTLDNINVLIKKLNECEVNMISITDHNIFDKELYLKLKEQENYGSLKKVLPGIELDLEINGDIVHTICIFSDEINEHADIIDREFQRKEKYTLSDLGNLLANIGLDVILIAHQKTDYLGKKQHSPNLSNCGLEIFYRMIDVEYFDSLEVQSSKVEGILKNRFVQDRINNQALISGSDCHDWSVYPLHDNTKKEKPLLIKMKAEASFRGLVMSITNTKRFIVDDIDLRKPFIKQIDLSINNEEKAIPLSYRINAIIGDNSVGKSTLVKAFLGIATDEALRFYSDHNIIVKKASISNSDYQFNAQGEIRKKFDNSDTKLPIKEDFKSQFKEINLSSQKQIISDIFESFNKLWDDNEDRYINKDKLRNRLVVSSYDSKKSYFLLFKSLLQTNENKYSGITKSFSEHLKLLAKLGHKYKQVLNGDDLIKMRMVYQQMDEIKDKYTQLEINEIFNNKIINCFSSTIANYQNRTEQQKSIEETNYNQYLKNITDFSRHFKKQLIFDNTKQINPFEDYEEILIKPIDNLLGEYHFISKPIYQKVITKDIIIDFIKNKINVDDVYNATKSQILSNIKSKRFNEKVYSNLNELKMALIEEFSETYFKTTVELKHGNDNLNESNSAGINSLYYLDIQSYIFDKKLFIIDQPEDDVSQTKINTVLLNSLRNFSKKSQVLIVTHNPQLVVNLDVDNVIVIKKNEEKDEITFTYGPLERKDAEVDMIKLVADTLEGGIDVIKKRWKRYEKAN